MALIPVSGSKEYRPPLHLRQPDFTLALGPYESKQSLISSVESKGHQISDLARRMIFSPQYALLGRLWVYDFFAATVQEVTNKYRVKTKTPELYTALHQLDFIDAPHESALAIREAYVDQPMDEWLPILSNPIADFRGEPSVLCVGRNSSGTWIVRTTVGADYVWRGQVPLLICRRHL